MPGRSLVVAPRQPGYDNQNLPVCETLYGDSNAVTPPYYAYRHSDHVIPSESCPVGGSSIAGLSSAFYSGGPYPAEYHGALFVADYTRRCIWAMEKGGTALPSPSNIVGSKNSFSPPSPQQLRGKQVFRTWSDGVTTATHPPITAPAGPASYTATFAKR
jgi:hypothetical protein